MAEMRRLVDDEPLHLMEHRGVRLVGIGAEGAAGRDDADRRLRRLHGADLDRRGVGAEHHALVRAGARIEIEGVVLLPCRMLVRHVERAEIIPVGLDMRPLGDREAHVAEDLDHLLPDLGDGVDRAHRLGPGGKRHVHRLGQEPRLKIGIAKRNAARLDLSGDPVLQRVQGGAGGFPLVRRHRAKTLQPLGDRALLAERGDAHFLERALIGCRGNRRGNLGFKGRKVGHFASHKRRRRARA